MEIEQKSGISVFEKDISPYVQGAIIIAATIVVDLLIYAFGAKGHLLTRTYWTTAITFVFVFALFNSILSLSTKNQNSYWLKSIISFVAVCITGGFLAYFFSKQSIDEAGPYRWMYTVFTMVYILILVIIRIMRKIVSIAQKQDKRMRGEE